MSRALVPPPCPACQRFIDGEAACPYCGAETGRPRHHLLFRCLAVILTVSGLALLKTL